MGRRSSGPCRRSERQSAGWCSSTLMQTSRGVGPRHHAALSHAGPAACWGTDHQRGIRLSTSRVHQVFGSSCRSALTTPRAEVCESAPGPDFGSSIVKQRARRNSRDERSITSSLTRCLASRSVDADGHRVRQKTTRGMGLRTAQRYSRRHSFILHARGKNTPFRSVPSVAKSLDDVSMGSDWKW